MNIIDLKSVDSKRTIQTTEINLDLKSVDSKRTIDKKSETDQKSVSKKSDETDYMGVRIEPDSSWNERDIDPDDGVETHDEAEQS